MAETAAPFAKVQGSLFNILALFVFLSVGKIDRVDRKAVSWSVLDLGCGRTESCASSSAGAPEYVHPAEINLREMRLE